MYYEFIYTDYQKAKLDNNVQTWEKLRDSRLKFPDWGCLANPCLIHGSKEYDFWLKKFKTVFSGTRCTFPFMLRVINSYLIEQQPKKYIILNTKKSIQLRAKRHKGNRIISARFKVYQIKNSTFLVR